MLKKILLSATLSLSLAGGCVRQNQELWKDGNISSDKNESVLNHYFTERENKELPYRTRLFLFKINL